MWVKKRAPWLHAGHESNRLVQGRVAGVRRLAQSIENNHIKVSKQRQAALRDVVHIRQVSGVAKAEARDFKPAVGERNALENRALDLHRSSQSMHFHPGTGGVWGIGVEGVIKYAFNHLGRVVIGIQRDFAFVLEAEWP